MTARIAVLTLAGALTAATTTAAAAGDFGISFQYRSHSPRYYSTRTPLYYGTYAPSDWCDYSSYYDYDVPLVYLDCAAPRVVVVDARRPVTYTTTYSRSYRHTRPARHARATVYHRSSERGRYSRHRTADRHHYRKPCRPTRASYQHHYSKPRHTSRASYRHLYSKLRPGTRAHYRHSSSPRRYGSTYDRHQRPQRRVRAHRR